LSQPAAKVWRHYQSRKTQLLPGGKSGPTIPARPAGQVLREKVGGLAKKKNAGWLGEATRKNRADTVLLHCEWPWKRKAKWAEKEGKKGQLGA